MMERPRFIDHRGRRILYLALAHASPRQHADGLRAAQEVILAQPGAGLLLLVDVTGAGVNRETEQVVGELFERTSDDVKACAFVGARGLKRRILEEAARTARGRHRFFDDLEAARDWLAGC
jgi:hypothetical protein